MMAFPGVNCGTLVCSKWLSWCVLPFSLQRISERKCTQRWRFNKIDISYWFIRNICKWRWHFFFLLFFTASVHCWGLQWLLVQFGATALICAVAPADLPTSAFASSVQMSTCEKGKWCCGILYENSVILWIPKGSWSLILWIPER